jgi:hypothetical protein
VPLAYHFGLHPWDVDRLTWWQFDAFCDAADEIARQASSTS